MQINIKKQHLNQVCPECGSKIHDLIDLYIDECDRCLAKTAE